MRPRFLLIMLMVLQPLCFAAWWWSDKPLVTDELIERVAKKHGEMARRRVVSWKKLMQEKKDSNEQEKLKTVNTFFNLMAFRSDAGQVGRTDYWMTPLEFLVKGGGDCEDFAIAKYFTLQALGVSEEKLRITYVKAILYNQAHMVLTYYEEPSAVPLVLDNLEGQILPATERKDLRPVYSFNAQGLWLARQRGQGRRVSGPDRISMWRDLKRRMAKETS